jgi:hypothetical protein
MDQAVLVESQVSDGQKILDWLAAEGVPVTAASWVKEGDSGRWRLYLVTPLVGEDGALKAAYRRVNSAIEGMGPLAWVDPFSIKLLGAHDPIAKGVLALRDRHSGRVPVHLGAHRFGYLPVEEVYIYPRA